MQEYRINYTLLIGLIVGTLVCSGAIYGLHKFQNSRQAGWLINEADKAIANKDFHTAALYYDQYVTIHNEDIDVKLKYANTNLDLLNQDDVDPEDMQRALGSLETMLRNKTIAAVPESKAVRRRLIDLYGKDTIRRYSEALDHLNLLIENEPNNVDLQVLRATFLAKSGNIDDVTKYAYKLIGYDTKKDAFDVKKALAPHATEVYFTLAGILQAKAGNPMLAGKVANQMVAVNPKDATAYVDRGRLRAAWGDIDGSKSDAQKALQLKPDDADVLLLVTDLAAQDKDYDKARKYLTDAKKLYPKDLRIYQRAATVEMQQKKTKEALAEFDAGAKAVGGNAATSLLFYKARLQIESNDSKGARQTIEDMNKSRKLMPEVNDFLDALILVAESKWYPAVEALSKLRPRMAVFNKEMAAEIDFDLALCYEKLGRWEQAKQYYDQLIQQNPQNAPAGIGAQRMKNALGLETTKKSSDPLQAKLMELLQKPKDQQDLAGIEQSIDDIAKKHNLDPTYVKLMKAQVAVSRQDYDGAAKIVLEVEKAAPENQQLQIKRFKIQLARLNPKIGPEKALAYWQKVVDQFGDQAVLRLDKAEILIALSKDKQDKQQLKQDLASLTTGIDSWKTPDKVELWKGFAHVYLMLNMMDEARQYLNLVADNQPQELVIRLDLFALALDANDADGMKSAQDKILQVVGDKNDSAWLYAEARRKLWLMRRGQLGQDALPEVRSLVKRALDQRAESGDLYALLAEVELMSNNAALALKNYDRAEELGRLKPIAVAAHIKLLTMYGRYAEAGKLLDKLPESLRQPYLGPLYTEILFRTDQVDEAVKQAKAATEADPTNAQSQYWYSQLLARSAQGEKVTEANRQQTINLAIQAMQKSTQLQPEFADAWFALINYYLMLDRENDAQKAMRDAQLVLSGDNLSLFLAKSYEALHRWFDAETMYREIYEANPTDLQRAQQLANFYMGPLYQRPDRTDKATPLINQLLKAGADGKLTPGDINLLWARRMAARILAGSKDYQNSKKAENLLASNSRDGSLLLEDKYSMAELLANRPEPISKKKAIALLEEIDRVQTLNEAAAIQLAELYFATRVEWSRYQGQMEKLITQYPNSVRAYESYIRRLLIRGDANAIDRAAALIVGLRKIAPNYPTTFELTVRVADKLGKQKEVAEELRRRMPNLDGTQELDPATKQTAAMFASLLADLKDYASAEKIYRALAARDPRLNYEMAKFIGLHGSPDECFATLTELYSPEKIPETLDVALSVVRERRDKVRDKYDAQIQRWLDAGLRENPDSITLLAFQADFLDVQKRYDDSAKLYRKVLDQKNLVGRSRAVVINNLAFLLALADKTVASDVDPLKLVSEAADILGPSSDILDTRAVVYISRGQFREAVADLELAVTDNPTASKYFHLAQAHLGAKESRAAVDAWGKAEGLGLSRESLNRMEYDQFEKVKAEIAKIRGPSVTKSDSVRKAS